MKKISIKGRSPFFERKAKRQTMRGRTFNDLQCLECTKPSCEKGSCEYFRRGGKTKKCKATNMQETNQD